MNVLSEYCTIIKNIGSGSFGEVYLAKKNDGNLIALKVEEKRKISRILHEYKIYRELKRKKMRGIPHVYDFFMAPEFNIMSMEYLGPSLEDLFNKQNKKFGEKYVAEIGIKIVKLLANLHKNGFVHRDIKPGNFLTGLKDPCKIYIMDFGLAKKIYIDNKHIERITGKSLTGTIRYVSINIHLGVEPSRRDDMESVGYMMAYFLRGNLPWQGLKKLHAGKDGNSGDLICEKKIMTPLDSLCKGFHPNFKHFLFHCRNLSFYDKPNYNYLISLLKEIREK